MKTFKILFAAIVFVGFTAGTFANDGQDEINATATVLQSAEINGERDLQFGEVTIGENKEVDADSENSGHFTLQTNSAGTIKFILPSNLTANVDGVTRNLPVNFDNGSYARVVGVDNDNEEEIVTFNPNDEAGLDLSGEDFDHAQTFDIYLGGEVQPDPNQPAGSYDATVDLTVEFN